jgi:hypothetical protein
MSFDGLLLPLVDPRHATLPSEDLAMRRSVLLVGLAILFSLVPSFVASAAVPGESPADTFQINDPRVRSVVLVGDNVWVGGQFTQVQSGSGSNVQGVTNLAVLDRTTGGLSGSASPLSLGGISGSQVWKLATDGSTVYASGKFKLTSGGKTYTNLVAFDGSTGNLIAAFQPKGVPVAHSVTVGGGTVYAGGRKLVAFDASTGVAAAGFATSTIATDASLRAHNTPPQHRDLELIGGFLYSACQCDSLTQGGTTRLVKALVRFDPLTGQHDQSFTPDGAGSAATGLDLATDGVDLYLGAGGSDYIARYTASGSQVWKRDTSGSTQAVAVSGDDVIIGGHFVKIADQTGDACGFKSSDPGTLDPGNECITRNQLASYSLDGALSSWNPSVTGKYNGVRSLALDGSRLHIGGEFKKVHGVAQTNYARLD